MFGDLNKVLRSFNCPEFVELRTKEANIGVVTHRLILCEKEQKSSDGRLTLPTKFIPPTIDTLLDLIPINKGYYLHVIQEDDDIGHCIALVSSKDGDKFFVDASHEYFVIATSDNFTKLGYKSILSASNISWSIFSGKKKRKHKSFNKPHQGSDQIIKKKLPPIPRKKKVDTSEGSSSTSVSKSGLGV